MCQDKHRFSGSSRLTAAIEIIWHVEDVYLADRAELLERQDINDHRLASVPHPVDESLHDWGSFCLYHDVEYSILVQTTIRRCINRSQKRKELINHRSRRLAATSGLFRSRLVAETDGGVGTQS